MTVRRVDALDGRALSLPTAGQVTLVDVWSTSCKPCLESMPSIEALWKNKKPQGLAVIGVAVDDNPGLVVEQIKRLGITYPNVVDADGSLQAALRASVLPQTLLVDRAGKVRFVIKGGSPADVDMIRRATEALLSE
jgi:cytochrome c biogenesis protein CcmG/thiol:disulfide interchange protein DsbE